MTLKTAKINFNNSGPWIQYACLIISTDPELMKLIFAVLSVINDRPYMFL